MYSNQFWGNLPDGRAADLITLTSPAGAVAEVSNFGGIIRSLTIPMGGGTSRNVVLGYQTPAEYVADTCYLGATVGPFANRIRGGQFTLDDTRYALEQNEGDNTLHGGHSGWQHDLFDYEADGDALVLKRRSPDGEGGFPGTVDCTVRFFWQDPLTFAITYHAVTDKATVLSMTNHSYFNLGPTDTVLTHTIQINADGYTPVDGALLPTGEVAPVAETDFDFRAMRPVGQAYDHNFALTGNGPAATLVSPDQKLQMDVYTDKPGIQLYTGEFLAAPFPSFGGLCLETQHFPDAPNIPAFPSAVVRPGEEYKTTTTFGFSVL